MTVTFVAPDTIELSGDCRIEDVEPLLRLLTPYGGQTVDWRMCDHLHAAVIQVLMAAGPKMLGTPRGGFLRTMIAPALGGTPGAML